MGKKFGLTRYPLIEGPKLSSIKVGRDVEIVMDQKPTFDSNTIARSYSIQVSFVQKVDEHSRYFQGVLGEVKIEVFLKNGDKIDGWAAFLN